MTLIKGKRVLSVSKVIDRGRNNFKNRNQSVKIVRTFFSEALKILISGEEIRFPKEGNGKLYLAVKHIDLKGIKRSQHICSKKKESFLKGIVKPVFQGFNINTVGRVGKDKKFTLRFSYPEKYISKLQKCFLDDSIRRKLPEIQ